jgi:hypothetical protein
VGRSRHRGPGAGPRRGLHDRAGPRRVRAAPAGIPGGAAARAVRLGRSARRRGAGLDRSRPARWGSDTRVHRARPAARAVWRAGGVGDRGTGRTAGVRGG